MLKRTQISSWVLVEEPKTISSQCLRMFIYKQCLYIWPYVSLHIGFAGDFTWPSCVGLSGFYLFLLFKAFAVLQQQVRVNPLSCELIEYSETSGCPQL